ncbi:MAG: hypothetical protein PHY34_02325 [Patescibacteria group bacterium]|nr:hypothetical protein [Patescibacteria group bacterium]MDD5715229.1 hypothetical protein [Patescibacteria group bacterium]
MIGILNLILPLLLQVLVVYGLSRLLDRIVLRKLGRTWYLAATWPGVVLHELSHFIACLLTFTRVHRVQLFHPSGDTLGFVEHEQTRNPLKLIIISIAPLFGVTGMLWLLTKVLVPSLYLEHVQAIQVAVSDFQSFNDFFRFSTTYFAQYWNHVSALWHTLDLGMWQTYVFIYCMLAASSHAAPSRVDLTHTFTGLGILGVLFVILYYLDQWLAVPITWTLIKWLTTPVYYLSSFLTYGIVFTAVGVAVFGAIAGVARLLKRGVSATLSV